MREKIMRARPQDIDWILPLRLRRGIREALGGGHGRLRIDPQELANRIGKAIDAEVERLGRIRARIEEKHETTKKLAAPESYFILRGCGVRPADERARAQIQAIFEDEAKLSTDH